MKLDQIRKITQWYLVWNKKGFTISLLGLVGAFVMIMIITKLSYYSDGIEYKLGVMYENGANTLCFVIGLCSMVYLFRMSRPFSTKSQRITFLMLPGTMNEKFTVMVLINALILPLVTVILSMVADCIQYLLSMILFTSDYRGFFSPEVLYKLTHPCDFLFASGARHQISILLILELILNSYGIMCGCLWTKHALGKGIILFVSVVFGLSAIVSFASGYFTFEISLNISHDGWLSILACLAIVASCTMLLIGHRAFVKRELIDRRWL